MPILSGAITFIVVFVGLYMVISSYNSQSPEDNLSNNSSFYIWILLIIIIALLLLILFTVTKKVNGMAVNKTVENMTMEKDTLDTETVEKVTMDNKPTEHVTIDDDTIKKEVLVEEILENDNISTETVEKEVLEKSNEENGIIDNEENISKEDNNFEDQQFLSDILEVINFHEILFRDNELSKPVPHEEIVHVNYMLRVIADRLYLNGEKKLSECLKKYHYNLNKLTSKTGEVDYDKYIYILSNIKKEILEILKESTTVSKTGF